MVYTAVSRRGGPGRENRLEPVDLIDDATVEALVAGRPVDKRFDHLAAFVHEARALKYRPPPKPSPDLAAFIARGGAPVGRATTTLHPRRRPSVAAGMVGLGLAAKVAVGASLGAAGVAAAGAAGVLPEAANHEVRHLIEAATPFEFPEPAVEFPEPAVEFPEPAVDRLLETARRPLGECGPMALRPARPGTDRPRRARRRPPPRQPHPVRTPRAPATRTTVAAGA
jgi:hypothetical protein